MSSRVLSFPSSTLVEPTRSISAVSGPLEGAANDNTGVGHCSHTPSGARSRALYAPPHTMGKRKRDAAEEGRSRTTAKNDGPVADEDPQRPGDHGRTGGPPSSSIQIVAGSYERVLHGVTATLPPHQTSEVVDGDASGVSFADTFLFHAHSSAIRCVAVSPSPAADQTERVQKVILATGGTDERINLYHLSARRPLAQPTMPTLAPAADTMENPKNRELGTLLHHASSITALKFVSRSKLLSSAEDNTIAVTRTRDWTVLSAIKAPLPRVSGRPTGDTAPPGTMPAGVNDFAVHPSRKLMLSVSKGERCMRLWNLMTGKKAGVLNFGREILQAIGERKAAGAGEARKVDWDAAGEEFVVGFERAAVVFNLVRLMIISHRGSLRRNPVGLTNSSG